jgi:NAD+ diphosphatase
MPLRAFRNTFAGNPLDRAADRRADAAWLAAELRGPDATVHVLWNGKLLVEDGLPRLASIDAGLADRLGEDGSRLLFLGRDARGAASFALDLNGPLDPAAGPLAGRGRFQGLRELATILTPEEAAIGATARAMFEWGRRTRFCPACGAPLTVTDGGWRRSCSTCSVEQFPRTDPVASWAPGRYSALAGFMEPGESIEEACAREIAEEAGLSVAAVRYHSSQPWPFPTNLMIGLIAEVEAGEARPADSELEAVRWVTRAKMREVLAAQSDDWPSGPTEAAHDPETPPPELGLPPPLAIARRLIESWANDEA